MTRLTIILVLLYGATGFAQELPKANKGLVKFSAFPFLYTQLFRQNSFWLSAYYERAFINKQNTYSFSVEYSNYTASLTLNGITVASTPDNVDLWIRPQVRHYFSNQPYQGYYVGFYPLYLYRNHPADPWKGNYFGLGISTGYQFMIHNKFPIDFNVRLSQQAGKISTVDMNLQPITKVDVFILLGFEINIGFSLKSAK